MDPKETIIQKLIKSKTKTPPALAKLKRQIAKEFKIPCFSNIELLRVYHKLVVNKRIKSSKIIENLLRTRPVRSLSGIVNISVLTKPYPCPGKCIFCPTQKDVPKSYLDNEPAVMRAILNKFDPAKQVQMRIRSLKMTGHPTDKIELRIIGGTWSFYPKTYQTWFIKKCFDACNKKGSKTLARAQEKNEKAKHRIIGLSIETRPDFVDKKEVKRMRKLGITGVELGVQSIYDDILKLNKRGHKIKATIEATKFLKDSGFKVCYQMMPNLPGSNLKKDGKMFEELFRSPDFRPDFLKIYPCAILKTAPLYKWHKQGRYKPYTEKQLKNLLKIIKKEIPYYVRVQRIIRDIPAQSIVAGAVKISNLRQVLAREMEKENWQCKCIRCREIKGNFKPKEKIYLFRKDYEASRGKEIFLSFENKSRTKLYSLLRLRVPYSKNFMPALKETAIIREVHTYGQQLPIGQDNNPAVSAQHKGLGKKLMKEVEKITEKEFKLNKIAVISGVGTRNYYKKLGYKLKDTYMIKDI